MLTRLKVSGFKNLVDVDVRFGPFTCVAGANGAGKSNLFDAIQFLSALASDSLRAAAESVRSSGERAGDGRELFHQVGEDYDDEMSFEVEMIVPRRGVDDLGEEVEADHTLLRYRLALIYSRGAFSDGFSDDFDISGPKVLREELAPIKDLDVLGFDYSGDWLDSVVYGRNIEPLISTQVEDGENVVRVHSRIGLQQLPARRLRKTMLSASTAAENPINLMARREMQSWRVMRLEPSALRRPDELSDLDNKVRLGVDGANMPATLYRLAHSSKNPEQVYSQVAGRLAELIDDVRDIDIDRDDKRALLTLQASDWGGTVYPARALSDGTLRFLALAVLEQDRNDYGVVCFEEPENGISPGRIPAMLRLLQDIATDTDYPVGPDNPLRQVIINTHSPAVVQQVPDDSLLFAELKNAVRDDRRFKRASFSYLSDTWRAKLDASGVVAKGNLLTYLNPVIREHDEANGFSEQRVIDRPDLQPYIPGAVTDDA